MEFTVQCCVCKRLRKSSFDWVKHDIDEEYVSHGYCPECFEEAMQKLTKHKNTYVGQRS